MKILNVLILLILTACTTPPKAPQMSAGMNPNLTRKEAQARKDLIHDIEYTLEFTLSEAKAYAGHSQIRFNLKKKADIRLDFHAGQMDQLTVNGRQASVSYNGHYVILPKALLNKGENQIEAKFRHDFSRQGKGLHQFKDPEDNRVYIYSDLEPFDANHIFPSFDQPDLKATYQMKVTAPSEWVVVTSVRESSTQVNSQGTLTWNFPRSEKFSTYIWSLHAGPYQIWTDNSGAIPLRLFSRQSLASYVDPKEWFRITHQGFDFFNAYFNYPYPYKKYDQLIVPEFNAGAMENVAAVTFNERFISRGEKSRAERRRLAGVILHEMAHMWFGNLVTMKWWNDLWLNESFATFMASLAMAEATEFSEAWRDFNRMKLWAYGEDEKTTTHPIETPVKDTLETFSNFDGITYGKGAAALKQLAYFIGPENFRQGIQNYFKKYAGQNTELKDFMSALSEASRRNLESWQEVWLQKSGFNTLEVDYSCENNKISDFQLRQSAPKEFDFVRPHSIEIAFLNKEKDQFHVSSTLKTEIETDNIKVHGAIGKLCPDIVYPNSNDYGYFKVALDAKSLKTLKDGIDSVADPFLRQLLWINLWDEVRNYKLSYIEMGELLLHSGLKVEYDDFVLQRIFQSLNGYNELSPSVFLYYQLGPLANSKQFEEFNTQVESMLWQRLQAAPGRSENQKHFFDIYTEIASSRPALNNLKRLLDGTLNLREFKLDQDKRWQLINRLAEFKFPGIERLISLEEKRDLSAFGKESSIAARAAMPDWNQKQKWISELKNKDSNYSLSQLGAAAGHLLPRSQGDLRQKYAERFYEDLQWAEDNLPFYRALLFTPLAPLNCSIIGDQKLGAFIDAKPEMNPSIKKRLRNTLEETQRCGKILERAS